MTDRPIDIIVAGHICLDIIPQLPDTGTDRIEKLIAPGKLVNVGPCTISTGGPVSNTGIACARLGAHVAYMAKVGDDAYGGIIREILGQHGETSGVSVTHGGATSYTVVLAPPGIDRVFLHCPGTNDLFTSQDIDWDLVSQASVFHLGYPPLMQALYAEEGAELVHIFQRAKECGVITSLDMSLPDPSSESGQAPWKRILEKVLPSVDLFLPSIEETYFMLQPEDFLRQKNAIGGAELIDEITTEQYRSLAQQLQHMGAQIAALKSGHRGYYFRTGSPERVVAGDLQAWTGRELWASAYQAPRTGSATGSGDSSIAGMLCAFLHGLPPEQSLRVANCVGWQNLHALDAVSGVRTWDETQSILASGELIPLEPNRPDDPCWTRLTEGVWCGSEDRCSG